MNGSEVALAAIGALITCIGCMVWVVKKVLSDVAPALEKHSQSADGLSNAVDKNTESNDEMIKFMRKLNGKLPKLVEEKKIEAGQNASTD